MASRSARSARTRTGLRQGSPRLRSGQALRQGPAQARRLVRALRQGSGQAKSARSVRAVKAVRGKPLTKREAAEFRRLLDEERTRLLEELEAMEEHTPEVEEQVGVDIGGGYDEDLADVASSTFEREKGLALETSVQHMLSQVEEALVRIREGTYGVCQRCGNQIDYARLKVLPYATLCIRCKELEERAHDSSR